MMVMPGQGRFADNMVECPEDHECARPASTKDEGTVAAALARCEARHRIKNNLHLLASMLALQAQRTTAPAARLALQEAVICIHAIASVQESLTHDTTKEEISLAVMLRQICHLMGQLCPTIRVICETETAPALLDATRAVPLSLIVNELLTNAVRHAYDSSGQTAAAHEVRVRLVEEAAALSITVADTGKGMATEGSACLAGTGSTIVQGLARQIGAAIQRCPMPGGGTVMRVRLPRHDRAPSACDDDRHDGACQSAPVASPAGRQ